MPELEIPQNIITLNEVVEYAQNTGRRLTDFVYHHVPLEVRGHSPIVGEHDYFLAFGAEFADTRPWKSITYHVPLLQQEEAFQYINMLGDKFPSYSYHQQGFRRNWVHHKLFVGHHKDERGVALISAEMVEGKKVPKIIYFHGDPRQFIGERR